MSGHKGEFASKDMFENMEKQKDPAYRKAHIEPRYMWQALGISLLGAVCGGLIFLAVNWWFSIFSVLFFLLNGMGAYAFTDVFLRAEKRNKYQIWMILLSDVLSVFATLIGIYLLVPLYAEERVNKGHSVLYALQNYLFAGTPHILRWGLGILLAFLGTLIVFLICKRTKRKK